MSAERRHSEFSRRLDRLSREMEADPDRVVTEERIIHKDRIVPMCSNTVLILAVAVPLLVWGWLWFCTPTWWTTTVNGVKVRDNKKIAITVIIVAIAALALVMLGGGRGSCM